MAIIYADASALVKLVLPERESAALRAYVDGADLASSELVVTEIPRAVRRAAGNNASLAPDPLMQRAGEVIDAIALYPVDYGLLMAAGAIVEPALRSLDAIHVTAAVSLDPIGAFVTYDERQAAVARLIGLRTVAPGA